jgi:hypothetical protein
VSVVPQASAWTSPPGAPAHSNNPNPAIHINVDDIRISPGSPDQMGPTPVGREACHSLSGGVTHSRMCQICYTVHTGCHKLMC